MSDTPARIPPAIARLAPDGNLTPRQRRRLLIEMALRRQKPGTGSSQAFLQQRTAMNPWPDLREILRGISWVVVGGVATRAYMPERMTKDLDILVREADGDAVVARLKAAGFKIASNLAVPGYLFQSPDGIEVDVIFGEAPWLAQALRHPPQDSAGYPVLGLPYLVLMKLAAMRAQDWADITRMLGLATNAQLDEVRAAVARYSPEDRDDLESLIFIGKKEQEPPSPEAD
jgi:hypothetical protein